MANSQITTQKLPSWDLTDLYMTINSPEIKKDLRKVGQLTKKFRENYRGKITRLKEKNFVKLFEDLEALECKSGKILSFAQLMHCQKSTCQDRIKFLSDIQDKLIIYRSRILFVALEINKMSDKHYKKIISKKSSLNRYKIFFEKNRAMKPYQLSEDLENLLNDYGSANRNAWCKLFDETISEINVEINGKKYSLEETLNLFQSPNSRMRMSAGIQLAKKFRENLKIFGRITNSLAKDKTK